MGCPFLAGKYMLSCAALREVYIPSDFEFGEYCKNIRFKMCPFYVKRDGGSTLRPIPPRKALNQMEKH